MFAIASADPSSIGSIFLWCAVLIVMLLIVFAGYAYLRLWMKQQSDEPVHLGFTLSDLRELHRQGKMSDEEFERTKAQMLGSAKKLADRLPEVLPRRAVKPKLDDGPPSPTIS